MSQENPYQAMGYATPVAQATTSERTIFIQRTYAHLCGAVLAFAGLEALVLNVFWDQLGPLVQSVTGGVYWLVFLGAFMAVGWVANGWAHSSTSRSMQYTGLSLYVLAEVIIFIPLLFMAEKYFEGTIASAGIVTGIVFGGLTIGCFITKFDFSFLKTALMIGGFAALGLIVASVFIGGLSLGIWFSVAMVVLAAGYILYNTSNVIHHYNTNQHVAASLALFASVALLFWYIVQIFMHSD